MGYVEDMLTMREKDGKHDPTEVATDRDTAFYLLMGATVEMFPDVHPTEFEDEAEEIASSIFDEEGNEDEDED